MSEWWKRRGPEAVLAALALVVFLGALGSMGLWGKREQRASAEAIDTVDHDHWLVARIQGRPRLEKPPLPRWTIAALITLTGRRDEWIVRLPSALSAIGMVALVYGLGCRLGGRPAGLTAGLALTSMGFFISELRQAGNDGPLAFFTTLALYAAWRRLHATPEDDATPGPRNWNLLFYVAMGLGLLCKGPIVVLLVAATVVPYLACARRLRSGLRLLVDIRGAGLFLLLSLSWPVPVLLDDPNALRIWIIEMGQKTGVAGVSHRPRLPMVADWPGMTVPWTLIGLFALVLPFRKPVEGFRPRIWFPWWWTVGNLAIFSTWSVAKPNYYLPCLPGAALLCGAEWIRLTQSAREPRPGGWLSRRVLELHWGGLLVAAVVVPVLAHYKAPEMERWVAVFGVALAVAVAVSLWACRRGEDGLSLAPLVGAMAVLVVIGYGALAPNEDAKRSHRALADSLDRLLPPDARTVMFFHELDEGLWFYLRGRDLVPVPDSHPEYNDTFTHLSDLRAERFVWDYDKRKEGQKQILLSWLRRSDRPSSYVLIRDVDYDLFASSLIGLAEPVYRESGLRRNELVLLRATTPAPIPVASKPDDARTLRR